jgi:RNA polymerase sigma-70 factor (ECF subfamily)
VPEQTIEEGPEVDGQPLVRPGGWTSAPGWAGWMRGSVHEAEATTIQAAAAGDQAAFERLVREHQVPVWRFLCHFLGDPALADDVTQETFLRAYRNLPRYEGRSRFSTWLFQIARNAAIDAIRSSSRRARLVASLPPPPASTPGPDGALELRAALASLDERRREALLLVEVQGFTYREAGEALGVPEGTVKSRVHLARAQLVAWLAVEDGVPDPPAPGAREVADDV